MAKTFNTKPDLSFLSGEDFEKWLSKNHAASRGIFVRLYKKSSGVQGIKTAALIDALLCYGWITGPAKKGDDDSYVLWWVCPRKKHSLWSKVNINRAERLIRDKRMKPPGMIEIESAKADGRFLRT